MDRISLRSLSQEKKNLSAIVMYKVVDNKLPVYPSVFWKKATLFTRFGRVQVDFSSPVIILNLLKVAVFCRDKADVERHPVPFKNCSPIFYF